MSTSDTRTSRTWPRPFIRWVGGKRWAIPLLVPLLPQSFGAYHEPFLGGGALFLAISHGGGGDGRAYLSDLDPDLIDAWTAVRDDHEGVFRALEALHAEHTVETYRQVFRTGPPHEASERAAWFIYLTNGGYDGAWKRTQLGRPTICPSRKPLAKLNGENLAACAMALDRSQLRVTDFRELVAKPGDLVVLDPPYLDPMGGETHPYFAAAWTKQDQRDVIDLARQLRQDGVHVVICQPESARTIAVFHDWMIITGSSNQVRRETFLLGCARESAKR